MKAIQRSIRMTDEVNNFVNSFEGDGFNQKFENLVLYCMKEIPLISGDIDRLQREREALRGELSHLKRLRREIAVIDDFVMRVQKSVNLNTVLPGQQSL